MWTKKKILILLSIFIGIIIIGLGIGLPIYFLNNDPAFLVLFGINFPFLLATYFFLNYFYHSINEQTNKKMVLITTILRFVVVFLSLGLTFLYLYLNSRNVTPDIFYIFIAPVMIGIGYFLGLLIK